jgi:hypothetical protein
MAARIPKGKRRFHVRLLIPDHLRADLVFFPREGAGVQVRQEE